MNQESSSNRNQIILVASLLGIGVVLLIVLVIFAFGRNFPPLAAAPATQTSTPPIPTMVIPTVDCGSSSLQLGTSTFKIETLIAGPDGSWSVPAGSSAIAYWAEGTDSNAVFIIPATPENMVVQATLSVGSTAKATWKNCNSTTYTLLAPQTGTLDVPALADQSRAGITLFFQTDASGAGFVYQGDLTEEQISTINTPAPSDVQAEISLLETTASADGTSLRVGVSIQNYGTLPLTLSASDVSLVQADSTPVTMISSEPVLPKEIAPAALETIYFNFQRPSSPTAILRIFAVEYDIEGY